MKTFYKSISVNLFLIASLILFSSTGLAAGPLAVARSVGGNVFIVENNKTRTLQEGETIYDFSEIITEEGSQVTIYDYHDHKYHLAGSGHIKFLNKIVELERGYLWVQSFHKSEKFEIQTANAVATYVDGEGIVSFDTATGKSQIVVITGSFEYANSLQKDVSTVVTDGQFSYVNMDYNNGIPRTPTALGYESYSKVTGLFVGINPMDKGMIPEEFLKKTPSVEKSPGRTIASIPNTIDDGVGQKKEGRVILLRKAPKPTVKFNIDEFNKSKIEKIARHHKKVTKRFTPEYVTKSNVQINVFGVPATAERMPASVIDRPVIEKSDSATKVSPSTSRKRGPASVYNPVEVKEDLFEKSLNSQYKQQMRHTNEVNSLIRDLQNYEQDYKNDY